MRIGLHILFWLSLLLPVNVLAVDEVNLWFEANQDYAAGNFEQAIDRYNELLEQGHTAPDLHYNLGNSHYKLGHLAQAILHYEKALKLDPGFEDAAYNLRLANLRVVDRIEPAPELFFERWWRLFTGSRSAGQWAVLTLTFFWLAAIAIGAMILLRNGTGKRIAFVTGLILAVMAVGSLAISLQRRSQELGERYGIVLPANTYAKSAPDGSATDLFILHEGVKVRLLDELGDWQRIRLPDDKTGWIRGEDVAGI